MLFTCILRRASWIIQSNLATPIIIGGRKSASGERAGREFRRGARPFVVIWGQQIHANTMMARNALFSAARNFHEIYFLDTGSKTGMQRRGVSKAFKLPQDKICQFAGYSIAASPNNSLHFPKIIVACTRPLAALLALVTSRARSIAW